MHLLTIALLLGVAAASADDVIHSRETRSLQDDSAGAECPARRPCWKNCGAAGYMTDIDGCPLCACNTPSNCPSIECPGRRGYCPHGHAVDEHGCSLCECAASASCDSLVAVTCRRHCEHGLVIGQDGCPVCECYQPTTDDLSDDDEDDDDEVEDGETGGTTVDCPTLRCRNHCAFGRHVNQAGCPTCACVRRRARQRQRQHQQDTQTDVMSVTDAAVDATADGTERPCAPTCNMYCRWGFKTDDDGCARCECNERPGASGRPGRPRRRRLRACTQQAQPMCAMFCPKGYRRNRRGCMICACVEDGITQPELPSSTGPQVDGGEAPGSLIQVSCRARRCHRFTNCAHGYRTNQAGCPTCLCNPRRQASATGAGVGVASVCPSMRRCRKHCEHGWAKDQHGCDVCQCREDDDDDDEMMMMQSDQPVSNNHPPDHVAADGSLTCDLSLVMTENQHRICSLEPVMGRCRASITRWYYNPSSQRCESFTYGGCRGNENNFSSELSCQEYCESS